MSRTLDSRLEGLLFDSQCWPRVEVSGKLRIPYCLIPPSCNGYLVYSSKSGSLVEGYSAAVRPLLREVKSEEYVK